MTTIALLVMTDGRVDCLERTIASAETNLHGPIGPKVLHNDSPDPLFRRWLQDAYSETWTIVHTDKRAGFGGAIRNAWDYLRTVEFDYLFATEDDFVFNRAVALEYMTAVLDECPDLAQIALRRQAWNHEERQAGGVVELHPNAYTDHVSNLGCPYMTHRLFFTTNPYMARRALLDNQWPNGPHSEGFFTQQLRQAGYLFAYWGARSDEPWVEHIGLERVGNGY